MYQSIYVYIYLSIYLSIYLFWIYIPMLSQHKGDETYNTLITFSEITEEVASLSVKRSECQGTCAGSSNFKLEYNL